MTTNISSVLPSPSPSLAGHHAGGGHAGGGVPSSGASDTSGRSILICLLRFDLRINDNPLFYYAHQSAAPPALAPVSRLIDENVAPKALLSSNAEYLLPVYVFDEREIELGGLPGYKRKGPEARTKHYGFWKTGASRTRFVSESVYDLRSRLREAKSDLLIRFGRPEDVVHNLVNAFQERGDYVEGVWMQKEMTSSEVNVENLIIERLQPTGVPVKFVYGKTLLHPTDLPFDVQDTPDIFTPFRKRVETLGRHMVRPTLKVPTQFKPFLYDLPKTPDFAFDVSYEVDVDGLAPQSADVSKKEDGQVSYYDILRYLLLPLKDPELPGSDGVALQHRPARSAFPLRGGESSGLERLNWYFYRGSSSDPSKWGRDDPPPVTHYKQTRNNLLGHAYSTKMSPFLAYGSISPRLIWEALNEHEQKFGEDQNTYWVRFELMWRDYFFFVAEKFGDLLFDIGGFELKTDPRQALKKLDSGWWQYYDRLTDDSEHPVRRWLEGRTGVPFIDANMIELRVSGFMSNRGRQNVASFLTKDLCYDWRIGAEFFQSHLIDYDPTSNYGNWQYVAGVGNDPRASRQFNAIKQAKDYDSHGEYVKTWIPALTKLPVDHVHTPWLLSEEERRRYGVKSTESEVTADGYLSKPMFEHESWKKHYDRKEGMGSKMRGNPQEKVKDGKVKRGKRMNVSTTVLSMGPASPTGHGPNSTYNGASSPAPTPGPTANQPSSPSPSTSTAARKARFPFRGIGGVLDGILPQLYRPSTPSASTTASSVSGSGSGSSNAGYSHSQPSRTNSPVHRIGGGSGIGRNASPSVGAGGGADSPSVGNSGAGNANANGAGAGQGYQGQGQGLRKADLEPSWRRGSAPPTPAPLAPDPAPASASTAANSSAGSGSASSSTPTPGAGTGNGNGNGNGNGAGAAPADLERSWRRTSAPSAPAPGAMGANQR